MRRQQKIRNPLPHRILMPTIPTHQLPRHNLRLQQQLMQLLRLLLTNLLRIRRRRFTRQGQSQLHETAANISISSRNENPKRRERGAIYYLTGHTPQSRPFHARKHVPYENRVEVYIDAFEFGVADVEGKGGGLGLAGFDGAGEEV